MSKLRVRPSPRTADGVAIDISPASAGWKYVGFKLIKLEPGESARGGEAGRETCVVILSGICDVRVGDRRFETVGARMSVFEDRAPYAIYASAGLRFDIEARTAAEISVCTAPGRDGGEVRLIAPDAISTDVRGQGTNQRFVRNILPETEPADSLLLAEVITPAGHWSSYPPHKHDSDAPPKESALEEIYYHRIDPPQGFAFQRVYTDDRSLDETVCVEDGDVVLVPRGYHPVGAPHGYQLYYLNVMAGPKRTWIFNNDPAHAWIASAR